MLNPTSVCRAFNLTSSLTNRCPINPLLNPKAFLILWSVCHKSLSAPISTSHPPPPLPRVCRESEFMHWHCCILFRFGHINEYRLSKCNNSAPGQGHAALLRLSQPADLNRYALSLWLHCRFWILKGSRAIFGGTLRSAFLERKLSWPSPLLT